MSLLDALSTCGQRHAYEHTRATVGKCANLVDFLMIISIYIYIYVACISGVYMYNIQIALSKYTLYIYIYIYIHICICNVYLDNAICILYI